ncbi:MAG: hypothetical protein AB199_00605 [Parcubacteria bacterium C7867-004]|nr:MAG: hypothetical protein AB199_00605 [Parcubacteria bacterium C7867-004]
MSVEMGQQNYLNKRPSLESYKAASIQALEEQFATIESDMRDGQKRSKYRLLLSVAYAELLSLEERGFLTEAQAAILHERSEAINDQLYEKAA